MANLYGKRSWDHNACSPTRGGGWWKPIAFVLALAGAAWWFFGDKF